VSGYVYFITTAEAERVKIGFTRNQPRTRLRELQTGSPFELCIIATERGTEQDERELHARFADCRLHGEWFELTEELREYINAANMREYEEASQLEQVAPYWARVGNAFRNGATLEEASAA
jgi:hypothetical protein